MGQSVNRQRSVAKKALIKAIIFSLPLFFLNYIIVSHLINDVGLPYFLSKYETVFYVLFNFILDVITFNLIHIIFKESSIHAHNILDSV